MQLIPQNSQQVLLQAAGMHVFAVFLNLGEHAAEYVGIDALLAGDFLFHFAQAIQFFQISAHDHTSLFVDDAGDAPAVIWVACGFP